MGITEWWNKKQEKWAAEEAQEKTQKEKINNLLEKFEIGELDDFLSRFLNNKPQIIIEEDDDGHKIEKRPSRKDYLEFIWKYIEKEEISYNQLKDFAKREQIVPPSFFGEESSKSVKDDFNIIIDAIKAGFEPEKIDDEEHLEAQFMTFLKAKFPEKKILRQVKIQENDRLDVLIDDKYAFELKVPYSRGDLRSLGAQLEEYKEYYPNLCAVIFENLTVDNLANEIKTYVDRYKRNYNIQSIILEGEKRE